MSSTSSNAQGRPEARTAPDVRAAWEACPGGTRGRCFQHRRDASFGVLLRRIKAEYEAALSLHQGGGDGGAQEERLSKENAQLRAELQGAAQREQRLTQQLAAYEARLQDS